MYHKNDCIENTPWSRRGHTRKPNWMVRGLYRLFDFIGDFGPMTSSFFKWIGRTIVGIWGFMVNSIMVLINIGLLVGVIYLSIGHSYKLLSYAGFSGAATWVAVAVWEAMFIYCSIVIQKSYRRGEKSSKAAWFGFLLGFAFVELSNILGMSQNWIGISIGIATPIILLVMKKVLEFQFKNKQPEQKTESWFSSMLPKRTDKVVEKELTTNQNNQPKLEEIPTDKLVNNQPKVVEEMVEKPTNLIEENTEKENSQPTKITVEKVVDQLPEKQPKPEPITNQKNQSENESSTNQNDNQYDQLNPVESIEVANNEPNQDTIDQPEDLPKSNANEAKEPTNFESENDTKITVEQPTKNEDETNQENDHINQIDDQLTNQKVDQIDTKKTGEIDQSSQEPTTKNSEQNNDEKDTKEPTKTSTKKTVKRTKRSTKSPEKMKRAALRWALKYYQENGKPPGRLKVEKNVGCGQSIARQVVDELKADLNNKAS